MSVKHPSVSNLGAVSTGLLPGLGRCFGYHWGGGTHAIQHIEDPATGRTESPLRITYFATLFRWRDTGTRR